MNVDYSYAAAPFLAWVMAGCLKFLINSIHEKRLAFDFIGYGGMPSNHSAIVASAAMLIAMKEGISHPAFGIAITLGFIVLLDASSLRRQIGKHAQILNEIAKPEVKLRERMGHAKSEILAGLMIGVGAGYFASLL